MFLEDVSSEPLWYVVHTYSGYENKVKTSLERAIENRGMKDYFFDIIIPMIEEVEIQDGEQKSALKKIFPGYVLIKMIMTDDTWYVVRNIRGVTGFVGFGNKPTPLTEQEIVALGVDASVKPVVDYDVGDTVRIISGALENFTGVVENINTEKGQVKVKVSMFGREISAELEYAQVQRVF
ncbi:MAG: transcription termination/antitermination factor NusG [Clostridia bacterium]|jgi:transcriptional antiterminator NusG|nr:transcription termination/antitermination factor NusG [Clostridia bacterium]MBR0157745.1 transcription termination/antitermination factor NusG [Clostridia bacterium]